MTPTMPSLAMTVNPEWALMIDQYTKRLDNRSKPPPRAYVNSGRYLALHAGANVGGRPTRALIQPSWDKVMAVAARAGLSARWVQTPSAPSSRAPCSWALDIDDRASAWPARQITPATLTCGAIIGIFSIESVATDAETGGAWFTGPYGWMFTYHRLAAPVPCRGNQGLWPIPADVRAAMRLEGDL